MRRTMIVTLSAIALSAGTMALTGCENKTEGERTHDAARQLENAGDMITRGEAQVRSGKAMEAAGRAAKEQGDTVEGNRQISEGQAMQKKGQADIEAGRRLKATS